jgi:hypothetical protein
VPGVIIPRSRQGDAVAPAVGLPQLQPEAPGLEPAVRGLQQGTAAVADIGEKIRRQEDEARVTDALTLAERRWQNALYAADTGLLQRRGVNALEGDGRRSVIDDGLEMRQSILDEAMATLGTPRQQTALKSAWASRQRFAVDSLQRHMDREREVYRDSADEGYIATQQEGLILAEDDIARSVFLAQIAGKAQEIADRKGLAPEAADVMIRELTSPALESAIGNMARTDPEGARKLFEDRREFIKADRFEAIGAKIERESVTLQSQDLTEQAFNANPGASLAQVQKWIRANSSGQVEDDALARASARWQVEDRARRDARENTSNGLDAGIWQFVSRPHTAQQTAAYRDELVRSIQDRGLDLSDGAALLRNFDSLTAGKPPETDAQVFWQLWNIRTKEPETFRDMDLAPWRAHFAREDFNEMQSEQKDLRAGGAGLKSSPSGLGSLEVAKKVAIDAGIDGKEWENQFELRAHRAIVSAQDAQPDKPLTAKQKEEIAVSVLAEIPVPDAGWFWFDGKKRVGEISAKERKTIESDPPDDLIEMTRRELALRGFPNPTDEQLRDAISDFLDVSGVPRE